MVDFGVRKEIVKLRLLKVVVYVQCFTTGLMPLSTAEGLLVACEETCNW
jgi:hypothetical protein